MNTTADISVIVSCYNYAAYVEEAIDSALAQQHAAREVIVVDDGSTDGSRALLQQRYANNSRVKLLLKDNGGQLSALRAGAAAASGAVLAFLDADDRWEHEHLRALATVYAADPRADFVYTNLRYFGARDDLWDATAGDYDHGLSVLPTLIRYEWFGAPTSALSMRTALAQRVLALPTTTEADWRVRADDCLIYGASLYGGRKRRLGAATARYRVHQANLWLGTAHDPLGDLRQRYRVQSLIAYYANCAGLNADALRYARLEFSTKPQPTRKELQLYRDLLWQSAMPLGKKLEQWWAMGRHYWRTRSMGSVA